VTVRGVTLSQEQAAVVAHRLEPLRISAGAGTGKTTTIVARLAAAIDSGIEPEAALGITFTNKAAEELADRLRSTLRDHASEGREVEVTTYHGFALRIVTEFGAVAGVERDLQVVGPGYVRQLLHESIGDGPYQHLDMSALPWRVDEAAALGAQVAGNLLEPEDVADAAPDSPDEVWLRRLELVEMLRRYRQRKRQVGVVDYGDLILLAHRVASEYPELAHRIRNRYRLVVLDEYQDTDPAQRELLRRIFGNGFPVTAVGDADQTIYEWRGASLENFAGFPDHFRTADSLAAPTLPLTLNRRSGPRILTMANAIRNELHGAVAIDPLQPADDAPDSLACGWFRTAWEEATWIAGEVRRLHDDEGAAWGDMAVLFRKNRQIAMVRDALAQADVPLEVASLGGLLSVPEVADVHAWLRVLGRPDDSVAAARVLLGGRYRLGLGDLAPLASWAKTQPDAGGDDLDYPVLEAIDRLPQVNGLSEVARQRLGEFRATYRRLLSEAQGITLVDLVRRIVDAVDGWSEIEAMQPAAGLSARLNLYRFLDLVEDWSPLAGRPSLEGFLGYLDLLQEDRSSDELDTARVGSQDAVSLLTVHRAKGLEWETVFIPALADATFPTRSQGFDDPLANPKWLPYELRLDSADLPNLPADSRERKAILRERHLAQELRTAYVAVTRAERRLFMTGAAWYDNTRPKTPSMLLELARTQPEATQIGWCDDPGEPPTDPPTVADAPDPHLAGGWRSALRATLADPSWPQRQTDDSTVFHRHLEQLELMLDGLPEPPDLDQTTQPTTSVTGLVTLASCPKRFYWSEIDRLPRKPSPWLQRGTVLHRRIELHHQGIAAFDLDSDIGSGNDEAAPAEGVDAFRAFLGSRFGGMRPAYIETPLDIDVEGTRIRGRIDAIFEAEPDMWEIVDYKSGRRRDDPAAVVQLEAYAMAAADGAVRGRRPERLRVTFAYFGTDPPEEVSHEVTSEWLAKARRHVEALAEAAGGRQFEPVPSSACERCDFLTFCDAGQRWIAAAAPDTVH
jgi:DNA helicase-2/ATP-dependent DNA helicase PcrA